MMRLPMLASKAKAPINTLAGSHIFDLKIDGVRGVLSYGNDRRIAITNRIGTDITYRYPDLTLQLPQGTILDGEIVASSGSFEDTLRRDQQQDPRKAAALAQIVPVTYIAFDVIRIGNSDVHQLPWSQRRELLDRIEGITRTPWSPDPNFLELTREIGQEGVIAKRLTAVYQFGNRSRDWLKYKNVRRVTCVAIGYERGQGARADFGAMFLAMLDDTGTPVRVGRVGSGFTQSDIALLKAKLDGGEFFPVEIECLNRTRTNQLRFPVYRGIRSDLSVLDASIDQLQDLPSA